MRCETNATAGKIKAAILSLGLIALTAVAEQGIEHSQRWNELVTPGGYLFFQRAAQSLTGDSPPTRVRLVDVSDWHRDDGPDGDARLERAIAGMLETHPAAIVVDVNLGRPALEDYTPNERARFRALAALARRGAAAKPPTTIAFVVVYRRDFGPDFAEAIRGTSPWAANEGFFKAAYMYTSATSLHDVPITERVAGALERDGFASPFPPLIQWDAPVAGEGRDERQSGHVDPIWLGERIPPEMGRDKMAPVATIAPVNYRAVPTFVRDAVKLDDAGNANFRDQVVVLGDLTTPTAGDTAAIPGTEARARALILASMFDTRLTAPVWTVPESRAFEFAALVGLFAWGARARFAWILGRIRMGHVAKEIGAGVLGALTVFGLCALVGPRFHFLFPGFLASVLFLLLETLVHLFVHDVRPGRRDSAEEGLPSERVGDALTFQSASDATSDPSG